MKGRRGQAAFLVPANGLVDLVVATLAFRHQHFILAPLYGALGLCLLVAHVRQWRWAPRWWDVVGLSVGLGLALGVLSAEGRAMW